MSQPIFILKIHSVVDLITNSSSELFIIDGDKTVEAVKETITKLVEFDDDINGTSNKANVFTSMLQEPRVSEYTWDYFNVPLPVREEYEIYNDVRSFYSGTYNSTDKNNPQNQPRYKKLEAKTNKLAKDLNVYEIGLYERDRAEYDRRNHEYHNKRDIIWKRYNIDRVKAEAALYKEFLRMNKIDETEINRVDEIIQKQIKLDYLPHSFTYHIPNADGTETEIKIGEEESPLERAASDLSLYLSYGIEVEKGDIMIHSISDNTVPYNVMASIENYLGAKRYHLG